MAVQKTPQNADAREARIRELTEENELLFDQLHVVQEELEKYYHKLKECEQRKGSADVGTIVSVSPQAAETLAENRKLRKMWKALDSSTPPAALGGKTFQKVLDSVPFLSPYGPMPNTYGDGSVARRITNILKTVQ